LSGIAAEAAEAADAAVWRAARSKARRAAAISELIGGMVAISALLIEPSLVRMNQRCLELYTLEPADL
jgi:hypothetical protein